MRQLTILNFLEKKERNDQSVSQLCNQIRVAIVARYRPSYFSSNASVALYKLANGNDVQAFNEALEVYLKNPKNIKTTLCRVIAQLLHIYCHFQLAEKASIRYMGDLPILTPRRYAGQSQDRLAVVLFAIGVLGAIPTGGVSVSLCSLLILDQPKRAQLSIRANNLREMRNGSDSDIKVQQFLQQLEQGDVDDTLIRQCQNSLYRYTGRFYSQSRASRKALESMRLIVGGSASGKAIEKAKQRLIDYIINPNNHGKRLMLNIFQVVCEEQTRYTR